MHTFTVVYYREASGKAPFETWFEVLDNTAAARVYATLLRLEAGNFADSKLLKGGIRERRIHSGPGYRVYYAVHQRRFIVLLGGGTKRSQAADIRKARKSWYEFKTRQI